MGKFNLKTLSQLQLRKSTLYLIFFVALICLLAINFFAYRQVQTLTLENDWVTHTHQVIQSVDEIMYEIADVEADQRGYLITGQEYFLSEVDLNKFQLKNNLIKLIELTRDNDDQRERINLFAQLVNQRLDMLSQVQQLKVNDKLFSEEGTDLFNRSQEFSLRAKALGQEIKSVELVLLKKRNEAVLSSANLTSFILTAGGSASIFFLIIAFLLTNFELTGRKKTESEMNFIQERQRKIIENSSDMIAAFDRENHFIIFNESYQDEFKALFGRTIEIGMALEDIFEDIGDSKYELVKIWRESLSTNAYEKNIEHLGDGKKKIYEMNSSLLQDGDHQIQGAVQSIRNITKRVEEHKALKQSYENLAVSMKALTEKNKQITLLVEMSDIMLASGSQAELSEIMQNYASLLLNFASGYLFVMHPSKNYLEKAIEWGEPQEQEVTFLPDHCWAIRLGRKHQISHDHQSLTCRHIKTLNGHQASVICVPLTAQNDIYGLLYLESADEDGLLNDENQKLLINAFSELSALALANMRLRENLRHQSIRDPLTGLYNRRYLEDFMFKLLHQAERKNSTFSVVMLDLDHFKKINDSFGHDAGDAVLKELGSVLEKNIRDGDIASRYGGEEFMIVFYDITPEDARKRAEIIRQEVAKVQSKYGAQHIGPVTISIGIACFPMDGVTPEALIEASDIALYEAKKRGRNRVEMFSDITP